MPQEGSLEQESEDSLDPDFVEVDPTGRYGRYKEVLGKGAFKKVYRAFDEFEGIEVAWNQVKVSELLRNSEDLERLYSEVHLLKTLKHKNIIKFYNSWIDTRNEHINFITEIFTSGTLRQYRKKHKHVDLRALKKWSRQILEGLEYLHSHDPPVIHRDLKCDNVFVNGNQGEVKIGDLGLAAILHHANAAHSVIGTPEFMAPELYEEEYNELVDIYAFGMCLLELVTLEYPYTECSNAAQIYKKVTTGVKPAALAKVTVPDVKAFIEKCIAHLPERLTARELLRDPFLSDVDPERIGRSLHVNLQQSACAEVRNNPSDSHPGPSRDLTVQGERKDVNTIFIKLRISDSTGNCRNIHFPFDIEADTSIAVASEMVHELDLTDQDITTIADMIDSEIQALIPDWSPRDSSTGESGFDSHTSEIKDGVSPHPLSDLRDDVSPMTNSSSFSSSTLFPDQLRSGRKFWSDSPRTGGGLSPIRSNPVSPSHLSMETHEDHFRNMHLPPMPEESSEELATELATSSSNFIGTFDGVVPDQRPKDDIRIQEKSISPVLVRNSVVEEVGKKCGVSNTESEEVSFFAEKLEQLLLEQQKELDQLKCKHESAVSHILKELSPQVRLKVLNSCCRKFPDYKLLPEMNLRSADAAPAESRASALNNSSGVSAKRIFTRSVSTMDLSISPRVYNNLTEAGTSRVDNERPSYFWNFNSFKKEFSSDGIAIILERQ